MLLCNKYSTVYYYSYFQASNAMPTYIVLLIQQLLPVILSVILLVTEMNWVEHLSSLLLPSTFLHRQIPFKSIFLVLQVLLLQIHLLSGQEQWEGQIHQCI